MDRIENYRQTLHAVLSRYASRRPVNTPNVERILIVDGDQFVLFSMGWHDKQYVHQCLIHAAIRDGQIWIYEDRTDPGLMEILIEHGIETDALVLGYVPEYERSAMEMAA